MINEGIEQGKYEESEDNILKELESFQSFFYCYFKDTPYCKQMLLTWYEPARFFALAKTYKFDNLSDINVNNLKLYRTWEYQLQKQPFQTALKNEY